MDKERIAEAIQKVRALKKTKWINKSEEKEKISMESTEETMRKR